MGFDRLIAMASEVDKRRKSAENSPVQDGTSPCKSASIPLGVEEELRKKIKELEARNLSVLKEKDQEIAEPNIQVKEVEQMAEEMAEDVTEEMRKKFEVVTRGCPPTWGARGCPTWRLSTAPRRRLSKLRTLL